MFACKTGRVGTSASFAVASKRIELTIGVTGGLRIVIGLLYGLLRRFGVYGL